ncbi:MAG: DUF4277 domain-containing protein [Betaproteobacteria bacterium]|nr:DUF4277 domain-containing protein [Betaproteobacteria bacterium]
MLLTFVYLALIIATEWTNRKSFPTHASPSAANAWVLPLINHFLQRIGLAALLEQFVPTTDRRCTFSHAAALGLLRSIIVEREPIYRQGETAVGFASGLFGLSAAGIEHLGDDRLGRALDHLFDADRAALLTAVVVAVGRSSASPSTSCTHSDLGGLLRPVSGRRRACAARAHRASHHLWLLQDHRPDLKQLLFSYDRRRRRRAGAVPGGRRQYQRFDHPH